ncbi:hypothetical protein [Streptomyces sp. NRRL F-5053]|uniref:hypothetical protein n=1 Tax=Streptomyces sp. NRRL F-5053 TaxID=1463854 RepID=UPI0019003CC0|nr:hypothetical protein [Streptomyces sp. NRRL F-5053]
MRSHGTGTMHSHGTGERTPTTGRTSRRGGPKNASAALLCLICAGTALLTAGCADGREGYVAAGGAAASKDAGQGNQRPEDGVTLVPLPGKDDGAAAHDKPGRTDASGTADGPDSGSADDDGTAAHRKNGGGSGDGGAGRDADSPGAPGGSGAAPSSGQDGAGPDTPDSPGGQTPGGSDGEDGDGGGEGGGPARPAVLEAGKIERAETDVRWCEKVTVRFRNTGGTAVTEGSVAFGTHIIGGLGVDWATRTSTRELPVPIEAGASRTKTWKLCVDAWRVPLGMHIETKDMKLTGWK